MESVGRDASGKHAYAPIVCPICIEPIDGVSAGVRLACAHAFHGKCIVAHLRRDKRCPACRAAPQHEEEDASDGSSSDEDPAGVCTERLLIGSRSRCSMRPWCVTICQTSVPSSRGSRARGRLLNDTDDEGGE